MKFGTLLGVPAVGDWLYGMDPVIKARVRAKSRRMCKAKCVLGPELRFE